MLLFNLNYEAKKCLLHQGRFNLLDRKLDNVPNIANPNSYSKSQAIVLTVEKTARRIVNAIFRDSKLSRLDLYQLNAN